MYHSRLTVESLVLILLLNSLKVLHLHRQKSRIAVPFWIVMTWLTHSELDSVNTYLYARLRKPACERNLPPASAWTHIQSQLLQPSRRLRLAKCWLQRQSKSNSHLLVCFMYNSDNKALCMYLDKAAALIGCSYKQGPEIAGCHML